ncbi:polyamine oxidase (exo-N4-amino) 1 [Clupea harengus]|uniref:Polyamine oxidase (Exo-N4-amino) 1 n=1 Tax=Clupea harengus TaxID=7950 RepID=A0A6P8G3S7_CLUHA|nr:polyamine oxidase (exo-N4-amino) 1 [Clupea harengus]XP_031430511.1 polyamine oxidase (exo-N4-amino) 1 [Clupea harengus]XP_031430512.1 polyamine oxidase (exo-N4-amino) 1 [Clupea harengus]
METNLKILVLGAGLAGIGAATKLLSLGFKDVTIIEASGLAGGRIAKECLGKSWVDTGAQYIHGASEANPVFCLMRQHGLLGDVVTEEGTDLVFHSKGRRISGDLAGRVYEAGEGIIRQPHKGNPGKNIGDYYAEKSLDLAKSWKSSSEDKDDVLSILSLVGKSLMIDIGAPALSSVSLDSWQYYTNMGEDLDIGGKMFNVTEKLLVDFPKERLLLNRPVIKINWNGSFCGDAGRLYPVCIECENGEKFLCDHVVVTISLGCLKAAPTTMFNPQLPEDKREALDKLGFGCVNKIILQYEEAFWERDAGSISLLWEDETPASLSTDATQWQKNIQLFTVMRPREKFGNVLIGWCSGNVAQHVETMTEAELSAAITSNFRKFMGNPNIPCPKTVLCTKWHGKAFIRGAYAYIPVGVDGVIMDTLARPLSSMKSSTEDLQVLFAGEATMKNLYGTVQGALLSGHREADRISQHYGRTAPSSTPCSSSAAT